MKRTPLRKVSDRQRVVNEVLSCIKQIRIAEMEKERGHAYCELCGTPQHHLNFPLSIFHIERRSKYPKMVINRFNILLACWQPEKYYYMKSPRCHNIWDHRPASDPARKRIEEKIKALRGADYAIQIRVMNESAYLPDINELLCTVQALKQEIKK